MAVLVDTGILLRAFVKADPNCGAIRTALLDLRRRNEELVVTFQNVAEFVNVSTRPVSARGGYGQHVQKVLARVSFVERICTQLGEDESTYQVWKNLIARHELTGVAVHDARLVATMLTHGIASVLTMNDRDFRRYESEGIRILTP
jgi:predicted nucleic acid-binding protein